MGHISHLALDLGSSLREEKDRCVLMWMGHLVSRYMPASINPLIPLSVPTQPGDNTSPFFVPPRPSPLHRPCQLLTECWEGFLQNFSQPLTSATAAGSPPPLSSLPITASQLTTAAAVTTSRFPGAGHRQTYSQAPCA